MVRVVLHQAVTDLRAQRTWVAVWLALLLLSAVLSWPWAVSSPYGDPLAWLPPLRTAMMYGVAAQYLLAMTIVARWIHADHAAASTSFWMSRPLSRRVMLAAKLADIGLWLLLPTIVVHLVLQVHAGLQLSRVPMAGIEIVSRELLCLLPVAAVASLTRDLTRIILLGISSLLLPLFIAAVVQRFALDAVPWEPMTSRTVVASVLWLAATLATLSYQYLRRSWPRSLLLLVVGVTATVTTLATWSPGLVRLSPPRLDPTINPDAISLSVSPAPPPRHPESTSSRWRQVRGTIHLLGLQGPYTARQVSTQARLVFSDGRVAEGTDDYYFFSDGFRRWLDVVGELTGATWWSSPARKDYYERVAHARDQAVLFSGRREDVAEWEEVGARYEGALEFEASRLFIAARLSLESAQSGVVNGSRATILTAGLEATDLAVVARYDRPRVLFVRASQGVHPEPYSAVLVHPRRRQAIYDYGRDDAKWNRKLGAMLWPPYVHPLLVTFRFDLGDAEDGTTQADREDWLRHGQLVLIGSEPAGRFTKQVSLPMKKRGE